MRFDRRFVMVVAVSLMWAMLVAGLFYRLVGGHHGSIVAAEPEKPLVVATQTVPAGAMLSRGMVKLSNVPERLFPSGGYSRIEDVIDRPVTSPIQPEEAVVEARLAARGSGLGLAPMIPSGMRAIAVRVNDVAGVAGFVLPGMRVDVLVTGQPPNHNNTMTRTVLQNILVLSAGQTTQTDGKSQAINVPVVTLLVTPDDAEALTLANVEGHIQLVLRNSTDEKTKMTRGRQLMELYGAAGAPPEPVQSIPVQPAPARAPSAAPSPGRKREPAEAAAPPKPAVPAHPAVPEQVVIIRGTAKTVENTPPKGGDIR